MYFSFTDFALSLKTFAKFFLASAAAFLSSLLNASSMALNLSTGKWLSTGTRTSSLSLIANSTFSLVSSFIFTFDKYCEAGNKSSNKDPKLNSANVPNFLTPASILLIPLWLSFKSFTCILNASTF